MAFTYADTPSAVQRDEVRLLCGDTVSFGDMSLTDAEIAYCITEKTTSQLAAILACELLAAKCRKYVDHTNIGISVSASQRAAAFEKQAELLRAQSSKNSVYKASIFVGGTSKDRANTLADDADAIQPSFMVGQDDFNTDWNGDDRYNDDD